MTNTNRSSRMTNTNTRLLSDAQLCALSVIADRNGDDKFFAACAAAFKGDIRARRAVTAAYEARRARRAATAAAR